MINVLIVDNHPIVRAGLEMYLATKPEFKVVGSLNNGLAIFDFLRTQKVDIIISEIDLPELNGITALKSIKREHNHVNVLMLSHQPEDIYAISTIKAGASGYLNKTTSVDAIAKALLHIYQGNTVLSPKIEKQLQQQGNYKSPSRWFKKLSTREVEVLKLLSEGKKNKAIANELNINEKTVSTYKSRLYKKLNVDNIVDLVHQAKHHQLA